MISTPAKNEIVTFLFFDQPYTDPPYRPIFLPKIIFDTKVFLNKFFFRAKYIWSQKYL